jgi:hypothetical protein
VGPSQRVATSSNNLNSLHEMTSIYVLYAVAVNGDLHDGKLPIVPDSKIIPTIPPCSRTLTLVCANIPAAVLGLIPANSPGA